MPILQKRNRPVRYFSTLELLVAMALVTVITMMLIRFFSNMQNVWRQTMSTTSVYQDSRIVFDVIMRDLQTAVAREDYLVGQEIRFHQPDTENLWFVGVSEDAADIPCKLVEIGYRFKNGEFQRATVDSTCSEWDVYGDRDDADDQDGYHRVVDGVVALTFSCVNRSMENYLPDNDPELPYAVTVEITLIDGQTRRRGEKLPVDKRQEFYASMSRSFRKTIHVSGWPNKL